MLNGFYASQHYHENLRRIRYKDPITDKALIFLTNNFVLPPLTIAALYKNRWQVLCAVVDYAQFQLPVFDRADPTGTRPTLGAPEFNS